MKKSKINGPTWLTILRVILSIVFLIFILIPETWTQVLALIIFVLAAITDKIDGIWARKKHLVTDLGAFLDPLADKMLVNLAFLALVYLGMVPVWVFAIILIRDFAVDGLRMTFAKKGTTISASFFGKLKTTSQMVALVVLMLNLVVRSAFIMTLGNILLCLAVIFTVLSGVNYFLKAYEKSIK